MNKLAFSYLSKTILLFCLLLSAFKSHAQIDLNAYSGGYIPVTSYNGVTRSNFTTVQVNLNGNSNLENWTLSVRFPNPIVTSGGVNFPIDKLKMRINHIEGSMQGSTPSITSMGADPSIIPMQMTDVSLIRNSPLKLYTPQGGYNQLKIIYDIIVEGGAYLKDFNQSQISSIPCIVTLKNGSGNIVHQTSFNNYSLHFILSDNPPIDNTYSIETSATAKNSFLEFKTISDYVNGAQVQYEKALKIISSTPYSIQVRSTSNQLSSSRSELPISIVQLSLIDSNNFSTLGNIGLSNSSQTLYNSNKAAKQPQYFDLRYFTKPRDERLLEAKPDTYTTTLIYTLTPQ